MLLSSRSHSHEHYQHPEDPPSSELDPRHFAGNQSEPDRVQFPQNSIFARKLDLPLPFPSEQSSDDERGFWDTLKVPPRNSIAQPTDPAHTSRLSSKGSDYEDIWSAVDGKSSEGGSMTDFGERQIGDLSIKATSAHDLSASSPSAKAVGSALRDLDALGDWIDNELHSQKSSSSISSRKPQADNCSITNNDYENTSPLTPEPQSHVDMNHVRRHVQEDSADAEAPPLPEKLRVIRRGKKRFMGQLDTAAAHSKNRFSAPNFAMDDILSECCNDQSISASVVDLNETTGAFPGATISVTPIMEDISSSPDQQVITLAADRESPICFTPPRKCMPSKDTNIIESFQSKVAALKRVGSKLLNRKSSVKSQSGTSGNSLPREEKTMPEILEEVLVFRAKKPTFDTCWPVDNDNWSVMNRVTPTSGISSGTSSSTKSINDLNSHTNHRHQSSRSSAESPTCSVHEPSEAADDFTQSSRNLEQEISLERTVNFILRNIKADFALNSRITIFLYEFAKNPAENINDLFLDLNAFLNLVRDTLFNNHLRSLEQFVSRDLSEDLCNPERYFEKAVQRLIVEPLHAKLVWNIQNNLGSGGDLAKLEQGCALVEKIAVEISKPELLSAVVSNLTAITAHMKSFTEAQNCIAKTKQLLTVFHDVFGIQADVLQLQYSDLIMAFLLAIAKAGAYTAEVHLDFLWSLQSDDVKSLESFNLLLASSCATDLLKLLGSDVELSKSNLIEKCMVPVRVEVGTLCGSVITTHNVRVPVPKSVRAGHLIQIICEALDLPMEQASRTRLQLTSGCIRIDLKDDLPVRPSLERWRKIYSDSMLALLIQSAPDPQNDHSNI